MLSNRELANAVRMLSIDAVEKARSGHVGLPLGMADAATVLFTKFLKHNPKDPNWPDRDRFVLSAGHGSMLIYALLYLTGYESVSLEDIKNFRQLGAKTPGHPENFITEGIETTTGPLGQGIATAVGMAMAERHLNARFGDDLIGHKTYVIAGDGCLMEGISQEAITLAGHMNLSNLVVLFDDNAVTIDGGTDIADSTDQCARFEASGWVSRKVDGHDSVDVEAALNWAQDQEKPVFLAVKTTIGFGAKRAGTGSAHGGPYGDEEVTNVRTALGWVHEPFEIPEENLKTWRASGQQSEEVYKAWHTRLANSSQKQEFEDAISGHVPPEIESAIDNHKAEIASGDAKKATRAWSGAALEVLTKYIPEMVGGSADLTGSNNTRTSSTTAMTPSDWGGRYVHYGVREHGMAAIMNGMSLHGGIIPYSGTFMVFSDYSRAAIRLGALMQTKVVHVMTHDSIGLGEDGPTHQPVEHLAALRAMPNLYVFRPCDGVEAAEAWQAALEVNGPSIMALSRQGVPNLRTNHVSENLTARGAYILSDAESAKAVLIGTGSELGLAMQAKADLADLGVPVRVVSMPCMELFAEQSEAYQSEILGEDLPIVAVEAGIRFGWDQWIGSSGGFIGMNGFGASAPAPKLYEYFGITSEAIVETIRSRLDG